MKSLHKNIARKNKEEKETNMNISKIRYKLNFDLIYGKKEVKND
jgi:hypothetical protein